MSENHRKLEIQPRIIRFRDAPNYLGMDRNRFNADSGEGGQCLRFKADSITVIADTCSRRRLHGSQMAIFSSSPELVL